MKRKKLIALLAACFASTAVHAQIDTTKVYQIDEVVVKSHRKTVEVNGALTTLRIAGTPYAKTGNLSDVLPNLPGLVKRSNGIEVQGSGKPIFVVDGRELQDEAELSMLQANNIKEVKIDKSPDARYSASTKAVVYISTKKSANDYLYLQVANAMMFLRKPHEIPSVNLRAKYKKFSSDLSYRYAYGDFITKETYFRELPTSGFALTQQHKLTSRENGHTVRWTGELQLNDYNRLGVYYYTQLGNPWDTETGIDEVKEAGQSSKEEFIEKSRPRPQLHSVTGFYRYSKGNTMLQFIQDYANRKGNNDRSTIMGNEEDNVLFSNTKQSYNIYTSNLRFTTTLPWEVDLVSGARYYQVNSNSRVLSSGKTNYDIPNENNMKVSEQNPQAYVQLARRFGNLKITPGLRYEYISRSVENRMDQGEAHKVKQSYSSLFPTLSLEWENDKGLQLYARYTRRVSQPYFGQINSGITYQDPYAYSVGNPDLRGSFTNDVRVGGSYKNFELEVDYSHIKNEIEDVEELAVPGSYIVKQYSHNVPNYKELSVAMSYYLSLGRVSAYADGRMHIPNVTVDIDGVPTKRNQVSFEASANLTYQPSDIVSIYTSFVHQGRRQYIIMTQRSVQQLNLGVNGSFANDRLTVTLEATDLLNRAHYNNMSYYFNRVLWGTRGRTDGRGVGIRLAYRIFNKTVRTATMNGNDGLLMRTQ